MTENRLGLGIDAGGTQTRWALAGSDDAIVAEGNVAGMTALQMGTEAGRAHLQSVLTTIAGALPAGKLPARVCMGMTGFTEGGKDIRMLAAHAIGLPPEAIALHSDIEIACLDLFAPGEGYVIYAGTGSIAAFVDANGKFHRAGGRGVIIDDAGGGFWIAVEALRHIWRAEDVREGSWRHSPMAMEVFVHVGGSDWTHSREFVYQRDRGDVGKLALAVAATADKDPIAREILHCAGTELARIGRAMIDRFGLKPLALAGRVARLHPVIEESLRAALPVGTKLIVSESDAHIAAAHIAARASLP